MNSHERMQRESNLVAIIRKKLPEFVKACADDTELVLIHQDAFAADTKKTNTLFSCRFKSRLTFLSPQLGDNPTHQRPRPLAAFVVAAKAAISLRGFRYG